MAWLNGLVQDTSEDNPLPVVESLPIPQPGTSLSKMGRVMPTKGKLYRTRPWMYTLAAILGCLWLISTFSGYNKGVSDEEYDEYGVLDAYGVSLMVAEQAAPMSWIERWIAGADENEVIRRDAIRTLEHARGQSQLEETGIVTLACLYWAVGEEDTCRSIIAELSKQEYINTEMLADLLADEALDQDQWESLEREIDDWPRDWVVCFLAEKALETQSKNYDRADELAALVDKRKQGYLIANTKINMVTLLIMLVGVICLIVLIRKRNTFCLGGVDSAFGRVSRLPTLWPLSLAVIVYVAGDFLADWISSAMWMLTPDLLLDHAMDFTSVLIDSYWRFFGVLAMLLVFLIRPDFVKRTLFKPVPKLAHWVLAACAVTWLFDMLLYQLPDNWFPFDPTVGHQWEEMGWSGLVTGLISAVIFAPICEELIYRGLLYNTIKNRLGVHAGVWISAAIFASVHFYGVQDLLAVGFFGVVMAYLYRMTNSLVPCILCHALFNLIVTVWNWILYQSPEELWELG